MKRLLLTCSLIPFIATCVNNVPLSGGYSPRKVEYFLNEDGALICPTADETYQEDRNGDQIADFVCHWYCASLDGAPNAEVFIIRMGDNDPHTTFIVIDVVTACLI